MSIDLTSTQTAATEARSVLSGIEVNTAPVHVGNANYEEFTPEEAVNVTVGVFYDGTLNNRSNVQSRVEHDKMTAGLPYDSTAAARFIMDSGQDTSYYNDESNVSRLEPYYPEQNDPKDSIFHIYIEGQGTTDYDDDSTMGYAFGTGGTGITGKVKVGCEKTAEKIKGLGEKKIQTLTIDTFGFSRGAAAARHFVHEIHKKEGDLKTVVAAGQSAVIINYSADMGILGEELSNAGIEVKRLIVRFVGIYDTVPSMGLPLNHKNNVRQLGLDTIRKANHVVHLTAQDEHRSNFSLTNINSAGDKGVELVLPGVHSDIGGGYIHGAPENVKLEVNSRLTPLREERQYLIDQGWYNEHQISVNTFWGQLWGNRDSISNRYSFIPLHMMGDFGITKGRIAFKKGPLERSYTMNDRYLETIKGLLYDYAFHGGSRINMQTDPVNTKLLRNGYFHFSATFDGFWDAMKPRYIDGVRTRQIFPG